MIFGVMEKEENGSKLKIAFAPMEGITGFVFRREHFRMFPGCSGYYMPFVSPHRDGSLKKKELRDLAPENNEGIPAVPQILTNDADSFCIVAERLAGLGYRTVDLNLGCPSPTVVPKKKGAGFLVDPNALDRFLSQIFERLDGVIGISVKTRLGLSSAEEAERLFAIFETYPVEVLIVHARTQRQMYAGEPDLETFSEIAASCRLPLCYNGNIGLTIAPEEFEARFPGIRTVMAGRGFAADPALARRYAGGKPASAAELEEFHGRLYDGYRSVFPGEEQAVGRMKELWSWWKVKHPEVGERSYRELQKAKSGRAYLSACGRIFDEMDP